MTAVGSSRSSHHTRHGEAGAGHAFRVVSSSPATLEIRYFSKKVLIVCANCDRSVCSVGRHSTDRGDSGAFFTPMAHGNALGLAEHLPCGDKTPCSHCLILCYLVS